MASQTLYECEQIFAAISNIDPLYFLISLVGQRRSYARVSLKRTAMAEATTPNLDNPSRIITDTNLDGKSVFSSELAETLPVVKNLDGALFRLGYVADKPLVSLAAGIDINTYATHLETPPRLLVPGGGAVIWYIDTPPNSTSPLHRTVSLDFVVQLEGELELMLDGGETRLLKPGDLTIQRATMHAWRNPSRNKWSRMLAVMSECKPVVVDGKELGPEFH
jgi:quercetin dioxygenase-like cupin family protein